ncbi:MAG: ABC transporter permease [Planctomycetota bacterium]
MLNYAIRRIFLTIPTLFGITLVTFMIMNLAPGDPAAMQMGEDANQDPEMSARVYEELRKEFGLDQPIHIRYFKWLGKLCTGDFGESWSGGSRPVADRIVERLPATISVSVLSIFLGMLIAIPMGILAAAWRDGWFDKLSSWTFYALFAIPSYVTAIILIRYIGVKWNLLPFQGITGDDYDTLGFFGKGMDIAAHFVLITIAYTYPGLAYNSRFVRQNLLETTKADFIRTARSKGATEGRVILRHAFPNTLIPLVTRLGLMLPALISGSVILERIFNWPGIGRLFFEGILARDYPLVMALSFISAVLVLIGTLISDLLYAVVDPRISYG